MKPAVTTLVVTVAVALICCTAASDGSNVHRRARQYKPANFDETSSSGNPLSPLTLAKHCDRRNVWIMARCLFVTVALIRSCCDASSICTRRRNSSRVGTCFVSRTATGCSVAALDGWRPNRNVRALNPPLSRVNYEDLLSLLKIPFVPEFEWGARIAIELMRASETGGDLNHKRPTTDRDRKPSDA